MMEETLKDVLDHISAAIIYLDNGLNVVYTNAAGKVFHGFSPDADVIGKNIHHLLPTESIEFIQPMLEDSIHNGTIHTFFAYTDSMGNRVPENHNFRETHYYRTRYNPRLDEQQQVIGVVILIEDLTQIKRAEYEIAEKSKDLEYLLRLLSHDFKEPLRTISSISQLAARKYADKIDAKGQEYFNYLHDASMHLHELVEGLMKFIKIELDTHEFAHIHTQSLVDQVLVSLKASIEEKETAIHIGDLPDFWGESVLIRQVFQNIITNAIKYVAPNEKPHISISGKESSNYVTFHIADKGRGIPVEFHKRVFQPFVRIDTQKSPQNLGIGLAICKRIVQSHGGDIWLESQLGVGTTVSFTFPKQKR